MTAHKTAYQNAKSGRVKQKLGHFSKTDIRYWQDGLFRETYRKNGRLHHTSGWYARLQHQGRRERFPLHTPNKAAAAAKARDIYLFLAANGWIQTLAKYKPRSQRQRDQSDNPETCTVGSFLATASPWIKSPRP